MRLQTTAFLVLTLFFDVASNAQTPSLLNSLFGDHAVLQRDKAIAIWGQASPTETVTVTLAGAVGHARADSSGRWTVTMPAMSAGGPFVLEARSSSGATQSAGDILIGDDFLCSGQSNMELAVLRAGDSQYEINTSANDGIRMLSVDHADSPSVLAEFRGLKKWQIASSTTVPDWSAVCFFFARELQKSIHVPIGLVHSSWGGSNIRPWMSAAALQATGSYQSLLSILSAYAKNPALGQLQFAAQWETWWRTQSHDLAGSEPWAIRSPPTPGAHTWRPAPTGLGDWRHWGGAGLENFTGLIWFRTQITLSVEQAASAATLALGPINQVDQTWINGRPIGNTFGYGSERTYSLAAGTLHPGVNVLVMNVLSTYGGGGLLAGGAKRQLVLAGGASIPLDGPWEYSVVPAEIGYPPRAPWESVGGLSTLYNAMIAPLGPFGFRGAVWYQGESNTGEAASYQGLLRGLMADWRRQFGPGLPFLIVQLPNFGPPPVAPSESGWAEVREAERRAVAGDAHAGLAVSIDVGEAHNLHPTNKQDVARRLARAARHVIYGESISPSGPVAIAATRGAGQIDVQFAEYESPLVAYSHENPIGFELCEDARGSCRFVQSHIDGSRVSLPMPGNLSPTRVRYCWADSPICTLFDGSGLPAGPFELNIQ